MRSERSNYRFDEERGNRNRNLKYNTLIYIALDATNCQMYQKYCANWVKLLQIGWTYLARYVARERSSIKKSERWDLIGTPFLLSSSSFLADESANRCLHHPASSHPPLIIQTGYNSRFKPGRNNCCESKVNFAVSLANADRWAIPA